MPIGLLDTLERHTTSALILNTPHFLFWILGYQGSLPLDTILDTAS
jgi:hypothetical protein